MKLGSFGGFSQAATQNCFNSNQEKKLDQQQSGLLSLSHSLTHSLIQAHAHAHTHHCFVVITIQLLGGTMLGCLPDG